MHARYYSFHTARFLSVDPAGGALGQSQSWNGYAYALGNAVKFVDPDGRNPVLPLILLPPVAECLFAGTVVGGTVAAERAAPPELRTSNVLVFVVAAQMSLAKDVLGAHDLVKKRDARTRPGPQARPEEGKRDKRREDRARQKREKPPREGRRHLRRDQPGEDKPVPDPDKPPSDKNQAIKKALVDLIADVLSRLAGSPK